MFFAGDSAGHCLPLTAEGIRTALYFGLACGRELRAVLEGRRTREQALERYGAFSDEHGWKFRWLLRLQRLVRQIEAYPPVHERTARHRSPVDHRPAFMHYLNIAPPSFVTAPPAAGARASRKRRRGSEGPSAPVAALRAYGCGLGRAR